MDANGELSESEFVTFVNVYANAEIASTFDALDNSVQQVFLDGKLDNVNLFLDIQDEAILSDLKNSESSSHLQDFCAAAEQAIGVFVGRGSGSLVIDNSVLIVSNETAAVREPDDTSTFSAFNSTGLDENAETTEGLPTVEPEVVAAGQDVSIPILDVINVSAAGRGLVRLGHGLFLFAQGVTLLWLLCADSF